VKLVGFNPRCQRMRDEVFRRPEARSSDFAFDEEVAAVFDDMLMRSVPFYEEQQRMTVELARRFWKPGTLVYDLGCSTGTTLLELARELPSARLVGYDNSEPMLERTRRKVAEAGLADRIDVKPGDLNGPPEDLCLDQAGIVTMLLTLQFVRPLRRDELIRKIFESLGDGGALIVYEKVLTRDAEVNRLFIDAYYEFKRNQGYTEMEIARKREALENVLVPYRIDENMELFRRNGFAVVEPFFQWFNFASFLCLKRS
jgi:tRNA (cmo5U34)-methyltransferase